MKYSLLTALALVLAAPAYAADMPAKVAALNSYAAAAPTWTGCYIGAQGGYGKATVDARKQFDESNWLAGGHLGCNYQAGNVVFGLETDAMLGGWTQLGWVGSTALRAGVLLSDNLLAYGAAGIVYGRLDTTLYDTSFTGWRAGGGLEYRLNRHFSVRAEYRYIDIAVTNFLPHAKVHAALAGFSIGF